MLGAIKAFLVSIATLLGIIKHRQIESAGRAKAERDIHENTFDAIKKGKRARSRVARDVDERKRLRDKYTRE